MKRKHVNSTARKILCTALSIAMVAANPAAVSFAAEAEASADEKPSVALTCETKALELVDNGRSVWAKVCLTQEDSLIAQNIFTEDIELGGVFRNMMVHDVQNDHDTILLDLVGVPDFSEDDGDAALQGTMEFPGFLFDRDDSVTASVDVIEKEGEKSTAPSFHPYLEGIRDRGSSLDMIIVLMPLVGEFVDGFSAEDIAFYQDLYGASIEDAREAEDGCYEITVNASKTGMGSENGYSCFGGIVLRGGSMADPEGTIYEEPVYAAREYSMDTVGKDLSNNDITKIKGIVGGFGNTTAGTILGVFNGIGTAYTIGSTVLGLVGVMPSDASRHAEIMAKLQAIQDKLNLVSAKCDYMSGVLDVHTRMLIDMTRDSNEKYLGTFDSQFKAMVSAMNSLENGLQDPLVQEEIEEVLLRLCEKYEVSQTNVGRDIDEDLLIDGSAYMENSGEISEEVYDYYPEAYDLFETGSSAEETVDLETLPDTGEPAEVQAVDAEGVETEVSLGEEETEQSLGEEEMELTSGEEDSELTSEEEEPETEETGRELNELEKKRFLKELNREVGKIYLTSQVTIGDRVRTILNYYETLYPMFDKADSSNPIVSFCDIHKATDNFATCSINEKEMYKQNIKYQFARALNILTALDSATAHQGELDAFNIRNGVDDGTIAANSEEAKNVIPWVNIDQIGPALKDANGNPYCYLMEGYVRLATFDELENFILPLKNHGKEVELFIKNASGLRVYGQDFARRMHGRTLQEELELAGIKNLQETRNAQHLYENNYTEYKKFGGIMFSLERWATYRAKKYVKANAWTDDLKYDIDGGNPSGLDWMGDGQYHAGAYITDSNGYVQASPDYIEWDARGVGAPPANVYDGDSKYDVFKFIYPMTYLVIV